MARSFFNQGWRGVAFFLLVCGCIYSTIFKHLVLLFAFICLGRRISFLEVTNTNSMKGKTVLITGGSFGIGYETALDMARRGAKVIIGCRSSEGLKEKIEATVPNSEVDVFKLDLSLKQSVLDFCAKVKAGHDKIHVFINNAALVSNPQFADEPYKNG